MAFWNRNKATDKIKYDGPNDVLVWKFPKEDFSTKTRLIVGPSQEVVFVNGGQVVGALTSGTYTLSADECPFIHLLTGISGGASPFSCTIYFVNKAVSMGIEWGTDTPISVFDPIYNVPIDIRSYGDFSLQVKDGRKLVEKLVAQTSLFSHQEIQQFFSNMMATQVRSVISGTMLEKELSPIGIDAHLADISDAAAENLRPLFATFGMMVNHFSIAAINTLELEPIKNTARELQKHRMETDVTTEDKRKIAKAQAFANRELGINEQQKWAAQMGRTLASKSGASADGSAAQANAVGAVEIARMLVNQPENSTQDAAKPAQESFEERIRKLKYMYESGAISQEQYDAKIHQMMNEI